MSEMERNKGKLIPVEMDVSHFTDQDWDDFYDGPYELINGQVYEAVYEVESDTDCCGFSEVEVNTDGSIDFHTYHYNGGGSLSEVIESSLKGVK